MCQATLLKILDTIEAIEAIEDITKEGEAKKDVAKLHDTMNKYNENSTVT